MSELQYKPIESPHTAMELREKVIATNGTESER